MIDLENTDIKYLEGSFDNKNNIFNEKNNNIESNNLKKIISKSALLLQKPDIIDHSQSNVHSSEGNSYSIPVILNFSYNKIYNIDKRSSTTENMSSSSKKNYVIHLPVFNQKNNIHNSFEDNKKLNENCLICEEKLTNEELNNNFIECFHGFCDDCYYNYFKEKINNNQIEKIKCPQINCNNIIYDNFIESKLINDLTLLNKYKKLKERKQLMLNPNIQLCPFPDCQSYAEKIDNNYVCCIENGHKFCFNCLKDWHGVKECNILFILYISTPN